MQAGLKPRQIAAVIDIDPATIWRFENGRGWPRTNLDALLGAYAAASGVTVTDIWRLAADLADEARPDADSAVSK